MVTRGDRCSLRCNRVVLFYTRVLSAFWRTKNVFESYSNFLNGSSFISFCWFCFESNFRKTPEAIEYKNFVILPKKKNLGHFNTSLHNQQGIDTDCSIHVLYKTWIFIDRLYRIIISGFINKSVMAWLRMTSNFQKYSNKIFFRV